MITRILEEINKEILNIIKNNYLVIVEGKKDLKALNEFNINNVIQLKNKPLFEVIENINNKDVVILTDLDIEGKKLYNKLRYNLQRKGIKIHNRLRNLLLKIKLTHIEGLSRYHDI